MSGIHSHWYTRVAGLTNRLFSPLLLGRLLPGSGTLLPQRLHLRRRTTMPPQGKQHQHREGAAEEAEAQQGPIHSLVWPLSGTKTA